MPKYLLSNAGVLCTVAVMSNFSISIYVYILSPGALRFKCIFHQHEVVSRYRDPQLQVAENNMEL